LCLHHSGLNAQSVLAGSERVLPTRLCVADELLQGGRERIALGVGAPERLIDPDVAGQALGLIEKLLCVLDRLVDRLQRRIRRSPFLAP
jgi:hypothetical protein